MRCTLGNTRRAGNRGGFKSVLHRLQGVRDYHRPMNDLGFDDVRLFARVAALRSLSAVARERSVPVSQVSRTLVRIEKRCGARLMHRSTHGLTLTTEGLLFLDYCRRFGDTLDELEGAFALQSGTVGGLVRVAASTVIAQYLVLPSLSALNQRHPLLRVELEVSDRLADLVREGIDIAIRTSAQLPQTLVARRLGSLGRALYAAPAYAEHAGLPSHPDELHAHRLIVNSAATHLNHWPFIIDGQSTQIAVEGWWRTNDTGMAANMVLQGLGIGRLATIAAEPLVRQQLLVPVLPGYVDPQPAPVHAVISSARQRLPKIKACIDHWVDWVGSQAR